MATFVIVHGGFGGGFEWSPVARLLRSRGHEVFTPTLTGTGERSHIDTKHPIALGMHVDDVVSVLEFEDLHDVVLCGQSYGGMVITGAADRAASRIALVVYIDALVPGDGQCALDVLPAAFGDMIRQGVAEHGESWRLAMPAAVRDASFPPGSVPDEEREHAIARIRPQPAASFTEPLRLTGASNGVPRAFIHCTGGDLSGAIGGDPMAQFAEKARHEGWLYRELAVAHAPHLVNPEATAAALHDLAGATGDGQPAA